MSEDTKNNNPQRWVDGTLTADDDAYLNLSTWAWTRFLVNMITPLVWYSVMYNPDRTIRPTWTYVFG
jgi:hypothetical protein